MKIIYLSGAMKDGDFNEYAKNAIFKPNPSNQNFHRRLIKALSLKAQIEAVSLRPFARGMFPYRSIISSAAREGDVSFSYLADATGWFHRLFIRPRLMRKAIETIVEQNADKDVVFLVDSLKFSLARIALSVARSKGIKVYAIVTDNPRMLSDASAPYIRAIESLYGRYDGFLTLSKGLNDYANRARKPSYLFEGLVEKTPPSEALEKGKYFFFGGALYERYGIKNLIAAFKNVKTDCELIIAGHGPLSDFVAAAHNGDPRIRYIGLLNHDDLANYQSHATLNINPRPFDDELDKYSVPSKVLEYLASGVPLLSTIHTSLHAQYCGEAIWIKDGSISSLSKAMELFLLLKPEDIKEKALRAKAKVLAQYALEIQGPKIVYFLTTSKSSFSIV